MCSSYLGILESVNDNQGSLLWDLSEPFMGITILRRGEVGVFFKVNFFSVVTQCQLQNTTEGGSRLLLVPLYLAMEIYEKFINIVNILEQCCLDRIFHCDGTLLGCPTWSY